MATVGNNPQTFSFDLPSNFNVQQGLPDGVTVDATTKKVTIDLTKITDSLELATFLEGQGLGAEYIADIAYPQLISPDANTTPGTSSFSTIKKLIVQQLFIEYVNDQLKSKGIVGDQAEKIRNFILTGKGTLTDTEQTLAFSIKEQATLEIQENVGLPSTWTIDSEDDESWTSIPPKAYNEDEQKVINDYYDKQVQDGLDHYIANADPPLTDAEVETLKSSVKDPSVLTDANLKAIMDQIKNDATTKTQGRYGLPASWIAGTKNDIDWQPVNLNPISAAKVNMVRSSMLADNLISLTKDIEESLKKRIDELKNQGVADDDPRMKACLSLLAYYQKTEKVADEIKKIMALIATFEAALAEKKSDLRLSNVKNADTDTDSKTDWDTLLEGMYGSMGLSQVYQDYYGKGSNIPDPVAQQQLNNELQARMQILLSDLMTGSDNTTADTMAMMLILLMALSGSGDNSFGNNLMAGLMLSGGLNGVAGFPTDLLGPLQPGGLVQTGSNSYLNTNGTNSVSAAMLVPLLIIMLGAMASGSGNVGDIASNPQAQATFTFGSSMIQNGGMDMLAAFLVALLGSSGGISPTLTGPAQASGLDQQNARLSAMIVTILAVLICAVLGSSDTGGGFVVGDSPTTPGGTNFSQGVMDALANLAAKGGGDQSVTDFIAAVTTLLGNLGSDSGSNLILGGAQAAVLLVSISLAEGEGDTEAIALLLQQLQLLLHQLEAMLSGGDVDLSQLTTDISGMKGGTNAGSGGGVSPTEYYC